jgi:Uma2 family endonuclease
MLLLDRPASEVLNTPLTLAEYLALPKDSRYEIVDGLLRPMTRAGKRNRTVQRRVANRLEDRAPNSLLVFEEEIVVLKVVPPTTRIPDVAVCRAEAVVDPDANHIGVADVLLAVEIVSPGSETEDRYHKPGDYARNGIPHFWRIELDPDIQVFTYHLENGVYREASVFRRGDRVTDPGLPWVDIAVAGLLGAFA